MTTIEPGTHVFVGTADGQQLPRVAVSNVVHGEDFPVIWITTEDEWGVARATDRDPDSWPWPAEDVKVAELA